MRHSAKKSKKPYGTKGWNRSQQTPRETKLKFRSESVLLDKGVVRRVYEARVRLALGQPPTLQQAEAANVWSRLCALSIPLYITAQTEHILQRRPALFATALLAQT